MLQADDVIHVGAGRHAGGPDRQRQPARDLRAEARRNGDRRAAHGWRLLGRGRPLAPGRSSASTTVPRCASCSWNCRQVRRAALANGDVLRAFSAVDVALPVQRQNKRVRVEGEVLRPGEYVLPPRELGRRCAAPLPAADDSGLSVRHRVQPRERARHAARELRARAARPRNRIGAQVRRRNAPARADEAAAQSGARQRQRAPDRQRCARQSPTGRVVLQMQPDSRELPELALEDGDRLYIPPRPTTVGVFGSVFNAGSYLYASSRNRRRIPQPGRRPDARRRPGSIFVIRANGSVVSGRQRQRLVQQQHGPRKASAPKPATPCSCPKRSTRPPSCRTRRTGPRSFTSSASALPAIRHARQMTATMQAAPRRLDAVERMTMTTAWTCSTCACCCCSTGSCWWLGPLLAGVGGAGHHLPDRSRPSRRAPCSCRRSSSKAPRRRCSLAGRAGRPGRRGGRHQEPGRPVRGADAEHHGRRPPHRRSSS